MCFFAISHIAFISAGLPIVCTTIIAFVLFVMASSILVSSMLRVSFLISTNFGTKPAALTALEVAINESDGTIISSPLLAFLRSYKARHEFIHASVPELIATFSLNPKSLPHSFSNCFTFGPLEAQFVSQTSMRFCRAISPNLSSPNSILFMTNKNHHVLLLTLKPHLPYQGPFYKPEKLLLDELTQ